MITREIAICDFHGCQAALCAAKDQTSVVPIIAMMFSSPLAVEHVREFVAVRAAHKQRSDLYHIFAALPDSPLVPAHEIH